MSFIGIFITAFGNEQQTPTSIAIAETLLDWPAFLPTSKEKDYGCVSLSVQDIRDVVQLVKFEGLMRFACHRGSEHESTW